MVFWTIKILPGDVILADQGFDASDSVRMQQGKLCLPAFTKGKINSLLLRLRKPGLLLTCVSMSKSDWMCSTKVHYATKNITKKIFSLREVVRNGH